MCYSGGMNELLRDPHWLRESYVDKGMTLAQVGDLAGASPAGVLYALRRASIATRHRGNPGGVSSHSNLNDPAWLRELYHDNGMSLAEIANMAGVPNDNKTTVRRALIRHGIPIRSISEATKGRVSPFKGRKHTPEARASIGRPGRPGAVWTTEMRERASQRALEGFGPDTGKRSAARGRREARYLFPIDYCERCGEKATDRHHRDGDTHNNSAENIAGLCRGCHISHHKKLPEGIWSRAYPDGCRACGLTLRKHMGHGFCTKCYFTRYPG